MKKGFTLIELLVVVLIIGVLSAIAIPMYQGAVDKSHWSTMLPGAKAIKDAEEAIKMSNGAYTDNMANLDVTMNNSDLTFALVMPNNTADPNVIRVTNSKLANVRLASYLDDNPKFAGQLHCEAKTGDERAERLCGKLLNGQDLTSADGYTGYLLDQDITKEICGNASRSWSSSKTKCYKSDTERCTALGNMGVLSEGQCGFANGSSRVVEAEGVCVSTENTFGNASCNNSVIKKGGECRTSPNKVGCVYLTVEEGGSCISYGDDTCSRSTYKGGTAMCNGAGYCGLWSTFDGGICVGNGIRNCVGSTFKNGAVCYANATGACGIYTSDAPGMNYQDTACCCGAYCPSTAPQCAPSRCDPKYMK